MIGRPFWSTPPHPMHRFYRPFSTSNPADAGCNSDKAQYSNTPVLQHSSTPLARIRGRRGRVRSALSFQTNHSSVVAASDFAIGENRPLNIKTNG
jgi:hypothetical protein